MTMVGSHLALFVEPFWFLLPLLYAAIWVALIVVAVMLLREWSHPSGWSGPSSSAVRLLEERYARGEIGRDEFLKSRTVLLGSNSHQDGPSPTGPEGFFGAGSDRPAHPIPPPPAS